MLQRIVYFSRNAIAESSERLHAEVQDILAKARVNNAAAGVTGALIFNSNGFAQVLEGELANVATIFERIQCDARHFDVLVLQYEPVEERRFPNWSMAYVGGSSADTRMFGAISDESGFNAGLFQADDVLQAIERMMHDQDEAPARRH